jgi:23S rRNA (guanosine2251-2'-O)-methyltransferase
MKHRRGRTRHPGDTHGGSPPRAKESSGERPARDSRRDVRPERESQREFRRERPARVEPKHPSRVEGGAARVPSTTQHHPESDDAHVFGVQPVLETLRAGARPVERITVAEGAHEARLHEIIELARGAGVPVRRVPRSELQRIAAGANHQGVVATVAAAHYRQTEELLDALAARVGTDDPPLALVLDGVEDPRNLGAIIRTAECAGAHGVFVPERRAAGLTETVAKAAAGALEYVPVARAANVVRLIEELKGRGVWTVGTSADTKTDYTGWDWTQPCALLLGGEGEGLRRLVRERCDVLVSVPLRGRIESLNVSVAAGVVLYEAVRQRTAAREAAYKESQKSER